MIQQKQEPAALELRDYQRDIAARVRDIFASDANARVLVQAPTGSGKSELAAWLLSPEGLFPGWDACIVTHRQELNGQTVKRLQKYGLPVCAGSATGSHGLPVVWKQASRAQPPGIIVIGIESWINRAEQGSTDPDCVLIIDEAHTTGGNERRQKAFQMHKGPLIALTATPDRMSPHEDFTGLCRYMVQGPQNRELMDRGFLAEYTLFGSQDAATELAKHQQRASESGDQWAARAYESSDVLRGVFTETAAQMWAAHPMRREDSKTLAFGCTIAHVERLRDLLTAQGVRVAVLKGDHNEAERAAVMADFEKPNADGGAAVLLNVNMVREGFDCPEADVLLCVRPTDSIPLWRQMCGRVFRPKPDGRDALILDLADNWDRLGRPDADMNWTLAGAEERKSGAEPEMVCRGPVVMDDDGLYIAEYPNRCRCGACGEHKPKECGCNGSVGSHHANTFTMGRIENLDMPEGCGAISSPGSHRCRGCGARFRKTCPASPDGCGRELTVKRWSGRFRKHRPGACDDCGEREESVSALLSRDEAATLRWIVAKSGNGFNLRLAPSPEAYADGRRAASIWVGVRQRRTTVALFPVPERIDPIGYRALSSRLENECSLGGYSVEQAKREVVRVLVDEYRVQGDQAKHLFGEPCPSCGVVLKSAKFPTCWGCRRSPDDIRREYQGVIAEVNDLAKQYPDAMRAMRYNDAASIAVQASAKCLRVAELANEAGDAAAVEQARARAAKCAELAETSRRQAS